MSFNNGPRTVTTGLSLLVDAADPLSYPGSGTSWTDIVTGITGSLSGSITYSSDFKGALVVNNSSSVIIFPTASGNFGSDSFTVELAFQPNQINGQHWLVAKNSGSFPSWGAFITGSGGSGRITAFFNVSSTVSCSMSTPVGSIVTGSNYLVDINFSPFVGGINAIYINSEASASALPNGSGSLTATSSLFISNRNSGSSVGTPLEIFNAKLYTPRLVVGRIRQNYNALSTRLGLPQKAFLPIVENRLLDTYAGASAAYSLRLLSLDYAGSAIRVRRSSDNAEQDIGFSNLVLDTAALLSFVGAGDGFVTVWYDQSNNANNATQSTAVNQPQIVSSGNVILVNNLPSLQFDGTNDTLISTNAVDPLFITAVNRPNTTATFKTILGADTSDSSNVGAIYFQYSNPSRIPTFARSTVSDTVSATDFVASGSSAVTNNVLNVMTGTRTSTTINVFINNSNIGTDTTSSALRPLGGTNSGRFNLMSGYYSRSIVDHLTGNLSEIILYTSDQSSNRTGIESNINLYYQIY